MSTAVKPNLFRTVKVEDSQYFAEIMHKTLRYAQLSPDPSTQNGAVLLRPLETYWGIHHEIVAETWAVNEFPEGIEYKDERWERPLKYSIIEHAERNAIYNAARHGIATKNFTMVCPWAACTDCARAIIQSGIRHLVTLEPAPTATNERWDDSIKVAMEMLDEAGLYVTFLDGSFDCKFTLRRNGQDIHF